MRLITKVLGLAVAATLLAGAANAAEKIRFAITDLVGLEQVQREFGTFRDVLSEKSGLEIDFYAVTNRTAAVEALRAEKVDFVLTGPAEYVVMHKKTKAYPVAGFSRPDYFSGVVVLADSGITSVQQLVDKRVAFGDVGSTSNHLAPMQVLADYGLDPRKEIKPMHVGYNVAWEALKRGDVAALGTNYGKFLRFRAKEKELEPGAYRVIARGPDLPNDVLLAAPHVDKAHVEAMRQAFAEHSAELIEAILVGEENAKYKGMKFLTGVSDNDYHYVRQMYATIGYPEYAEFVGE